MLLALNFTLYMFLIIVLLYFDYLFNVYVAVKTLFLSSVSW